MIIKFDKEIRKSEVLSMVIFQGMPVIATLTGVSIKIEAIGEVKHSYFIRYRNETDAMEDLLRINVALCYNKKDNPEMFL